MAPQQKSDRLHVGDSYLVTAGEFEGQMARILNNKVGAEQPRKILVDVAGEQVNVLPRVLKAPEWDELKGKGRTRAEAAQAPVVYQPLAAVPAPVVTQVVPVATLVRAQVPITSVDDPRLDSYRPDPAVVQAYVNRILPGDIKDTDFLLSFYEDRTNIMLVGDTQAGKSMMVQVLAVLAGRLRAEKLGRDPAEAKPLPIFPLSGSSGVTDFDLFGQVTPYTDPATQTERLVDLQGIVDMACRAGGILELDEVNKMADRVTASLHPITDWRRKYVNRGKAVQVLNEDGSETFVPDIVRVNEDLWIIGTINPGYRGAGALNEAFVNRFEWIPWDYDEAVERRLIKYQTVITLGMALRMIRSEGTITTPIGTKPLMRLCDNIDKHGVESALWMLVAMFQKREQGLVEETISIRSIRQGLEDEMSGRAMSETEAAPHQSSSAGG